VVRSLKFHEALLELLCPDCSKCFLHFLGGVADFLEFLGAEEEGMRKRWRQKNSHEMFIVY
jgi:hypothetical protein